MTFRLAIQRLLLYFESLTRPCVWKRQVFSCSFENWSNTVRCVCATKQIWLRVVVRYWLYVHLSRNAIVYTVTVFIYVCSPLVSFPSLLTFMYGSLNTSLPIFRVSQRYLFRFDRKYSFNPSIIKKMLIIPIEEATYFSWFNNFLRNHVR